MKSQNHQFLEEDDLGGYFQNSYLNSHLSKVNSNKQFKKSQAFLSFALCNCWIILTTLTEFKITNKIHSD